MAQVYISEWYPSPRSSSFDPAIHSPPTHPPILDFDPDFDTRMKSPSPCDATMLPPPPPPETPKRTKKIARVGIAPRRPKALILSPRRPSPAKATSAEANLRRARIYSGSSPGRTLSGSSLRVAGSVIGSSPERLALLSSGSPFRNRLPSPYISPSKRKGSGMSGKKSTSSPSPKVSLGLLGSVMGSLRGLRTRGLSKLKLPQRTQDGKRYVKAGSVCDEKEGGMEIDTEPDAEDALNDGALTRYGQPSFTRSSSSSTSTSFNAPNPPFAIVSPEDALSAELDELLFGPKEPMSPATAMGFLNIGGSSSTPDLVNTAEEAGSNPVMTADAYQQAIGSRSVDTLPLSTHWGIEPQPWTGTTSMWSHGSHMTPPESPASVSPSTRRARSRGKAVRVLGVEARTAAGMSGRKGAACASYKEAMQKEFDRRNAKAEAYDMFRDGSGKTTSGTGVAKRPSKRSKGRINSN